MTQHPVVSGSLHHAINGTVNDTFVRHIIQHPEVSISLYQVISGAVNCLVFIAEIILNVCNCGKMLHMLITLKIVNQEPICRRM